MSLPTGYTELEYLQSSGTQYIDTGFKPNHDTRVICKGCLDVDESAQWLFGARHSASQANFGFCTYKSKYYAYYNTSGKAFDTSLNTSGILTVDCNKNTAELTANGMTDTVTASLTINKTFECDYPLVLFACNTRGTISAASAVIYSCKIYDDGVLVRDYIPCKNASGAAGFYDVVNGVFYPNSGSGSFIEGDEVSRVPDAPSNLPDTPSNLAVQVMGSDAVLSWNADENAVGYRIYRRTELIGETGDTQYRLTGLEKYTSHTYSVSSYDEETESEAAAVSFFVNGSENPLSDLITDRTAADVTVRTKKGSYNASDMNRVSAAAEYVRGIIRSFGYTLPDGVKRRWAENDIPDAAELERHLADVLSVDAINYAAEKLILPQSMNRLTYEGANTIEKFLRMIGEAAERIPEAYIYSDEIYGGENY